MGFITITFAFKVFGTHRTFRRECLDQVFIYGEGHMRRILSAYAAHYNRTRTHLALQKDVPIGRTIQRFGEIIGMPVLAGLHHQYVRMLFSEGTELAVASIR